MDKKSQDLAWNCLPKEFKEEVKELYDSGIKMMDIRPSASEIYANKLSTLEGIFGIHNLTSDAEGEVDEILHVSRKQVQKAYKECDRYFCFEGMLEDLFGSKCLPDEPPLKITAAEDCIAMAKQEMGIEDEPKPAEPKFKVGDKVKDISSPHDDGIYKVDDIKKSSDGFIYHIQGLIGKSNVKESDLRPYTEPKEESRNLSQEAANCDKQFDTILKDSFSKERRLNIATQITASFYSNDKVTSWFHSIEALVRKALDIADTLIAECEKKGDHDGED